MGCPKSIPKKDCPHSGGNNSSQATPLGGARRIARTTPTVARKQPRGKRPVISVIR